MRSYRPSPALTNLLDVVAETNLSALAMSADQETVWPAKASILAGQIASFSNRAEAMRSRLTPLPSPAMTAAKSIPDPTAPSPASRLVAAVHIRPDSDRRRHMRYPHATGCRIAIGGTDAHVRTQSIGMGGVMIDTPGLAVVRRGMLGHLWLGDLGPARVRVRNVQPHGLHLAFADNLRPEFEAALNGLMLRLETENVFAIAHARGLAMVIEETFENALKQGRIDVRRLMSCRYTPVSGSNPLQFLHEALPFYEEVLPGAQARHFVPRLGMIYALATDRNGYVPVHNEGFCEVQRPDDPAFNLAFARNRRIFGDTTTIVAARHARHPVVQSYWRDTGQGRAALVRSIGVPIMVRERRWGCAQVAYRMEDN
jgi:methyl-accepting chemotaxis protein